MMDAITTLDLGRRDPTIARLASSVRNPPRHRLEARLFETLAGAVAAYQNTLRQNPFLKAPPGTLTGEFVVAAQKADAQPIGHTKENLTQHVLITGATGSGKTTYGHHLIHQALNAGIKAWAFDPKNDLNRTAVDNNFLVIDADTPLNPLEPSPYLSPSTHKNLFIDTFANAYWGGEITKHILNEALTSLQKTGNAFSIDDLQTTVDKLYDHKDTYQRRDGVRGVSLRLQRFRDVYPTIAKTRNGIPFKELTQHSIILDVDTPSPADEFLFTLLVNHLYHAKLANQDQALTHLVLIDEGLLLWSTNNNNISGTPILADLTGRIRSSGIGMIVTTNSLSLTSQALRSNTRTTIVVPQADGNDQRQASISLGLNTTQAEYLTKNLTRGEAIIQLPNYREPILAVFPPLPPTSPVTPQEWHALKDRTRSLAPPPAPSPAPTPAPAPAPPTKPVTIAPNKPVTLTPQQEGLLSAVADLVIPTSTIAYKKAGLTLSIGDTAAKHLEVLGFLDRNPVVARPGRGGSAIALELTKLGWERLGKKPPHGTRAGDSPQHRFLVHHITQHLKGSKVEATVGVGGRAGKSVDVLLRVSAEHERLLQVIASNAHYLCPNHHDLAVGDLASIEVEVSDPSKTAPPNAIANSEHGITTTIIAVMPKALDATRKHLLKDLPSEVLPRVIVIDALQLLEGLRERQ